MSDLFNVVAIMALMVFSIGLIKPSLFKDKQTGAVPTRKVIATGSMSLFIIAIILASLTSTNGSAESDFEFTNEGIKQLDADISTVNLIKQAMSDDPESYAVEIEIRRDPYSADHEWNYISQTYVHRIGVKLLDKQQVSRLRMVFISPSDGNKQWAQVKISKKDFPSNWKDFSYHQFFSRTNPDPTTFQTKSWLCKYYQQYESSRPNGVIPPWCSRFMDGRFD